MKKRTQKEKKGRSLFKKYYLTISSMFLIGIITMGFWLTIVISVQWWNDKVDNLKFNSQEIVKTIEDMDFDSNDSGMREVVSNTLSVVNKSTNSDYYVTDLTGRIIICSDSLNEYAYNSNCEKHSVLMMNEEHMSRALNDGFSEYATSSELGFGKFILAIPISLNGEKIAAVYAVEDAVTGLIPYVMSIIQTTFAVSVAILLVSFIFIFILCRGITNPISEMQEATHHFAKGDFKYRVSENYKEETLKQFARSLNKMADDLAIEDEAQKSFVANVSHELKTPMTSIGGFIDGIRDGTIPREKEMEYLDIVSGEIKRLSRMVVSMLNLSKIESGEVGLTPTEYDISAQIFETLLSFEQRIEDKHVNIEGFEEMGQVKILADRDLLQQVIYNLLDNAVKFVDENGTITVFAEKSEEGTKVIIRNSGKGVSNEEISRIFERFYKVDKSRSYDTKGVGLGLYIVKTIINMHDGEIKASSDENAYTQFEFFIPS